MKAKVSKRLRKILKDKDARKQLETVLTHGIAGEVTVDSDTYTVCRVHTVAPAEQRPQSRRQS